MIGTIVAKPVRSGEGTVVADIDFTLIDRTPTARVHKRAAPAANGEGRFSLMGRQMQDAV